MIDLSRAPFPVAYREIWIPRGINGDASLPSSRQDGQGLAFTGARRGTTTDGVRFDGSVNSNISSGAIHDNAPELWLSFRFKLDATYTAGAGADEYLWSKRLDATHYVWLVLKTADGKLYFEGDDGGVKTFSIAARDGVVDITSWTLNTWYNVIASISSTLGVRLLINYGTAVTDVSTLAAPNGGSFVIGDQTVGGGVGITGVIVDFFCGTDDLSANEERELEAGIPPNDVVNEYLLDEGRGVTAYDRGPGANNGTLGSACAWEYGNCQQPVISFDKLNDRAVSPAGVNLNGSITAVWVGKLKSTYAAMNVGPHELFEFYADADNYLAFSHGLGNNRLGTYARGLASSVWAYQESDTRNIDDYLIALITYDTDTISLYLNGVFIHSEAGGNPIIGLAVANIGHADGAVSFDISKPLFIALINGCFTAADVLAYSRFLDRILHTGLEI